MALLPVKLFLQGAKSLKAKIQYIQMLKIRNANAEDFQ